MNVKNQIANKASVQIESKELKALQSRGAVSNIPLMKGAVIAFGDDSQAFTANRMIGNNLVIMVVAADLHGDVNGEWSENADAVMLSTMSFGRCNINRATGEIITPETVAKSSGEEFNSEKLVYNQLKELNLLQVSDYLKGKKFRLLGTQDVGLVLPDGSPRLQADTGQQMFQTIYAWEEI